MPRIHPIVRFVLYDDSGTVRQIGECPSNMLSYQGRDVGLKVARFRWDIPDIRAYRVEEGKVLTQEVVIDIEEVRNNKLMAADEAFSTLFQGIIGPFEYVHKMKREGKLVRNEAERIQAVEKAKQQDELIERLEIKRMNLKDEIRQASTVEELNGIKLELHEIISSLTPKNEAGGKNESRSR